MTQDEWSLAFFNQTMRVLLLCLVIVFVSCTPHGVREAQEVVALADSLREAHLVAQDEYSDSTHLAQAYYTLEKWQWLYPDDFAHACYHYGRKLRDKDNPVAAMQVFLAATHSRTHDYHILARVYSNIGDIAHLAGEFQLSYEMYEMCANYFLQGNDSMRYYYALNRMSFELAEQGESDKSIVLLNQLVKRCDDSNIIAKTWETRAEIYRKISQYDSALYFTKSLINIGYVSPSIYVQMAWSYEHLGKTDSAIWYAKQVLEDKESSVQDQYNMLYILYNYDTTLTHEEVLKLTAQRSDIGFDILDPLHTQYAIAIYVYRNDNNAIPDRRWLYAIIATILVLGIVNGCLVYKKRKRHQLLSQQIEDLESKNKSVVSQLRIRVDSNIALLSKSHNLKKDLHWDNFELFCQEVNQQFNMLATKLQAQQVLNETQIRLCILVLLNLSRSSIAETLPYAINSIGKLKDQTAKLLGTTGKNLRTYLLQLAIEG